MKRYLTLILILLVPALAVWAAGLLVTGPLTVEGDSELLGDLTVGDDALFVDLGFDETHINSTLIVWSAAGGGAVIVHPDGSVELPARTSAPFTCASKSAGRFYFDTSGAFCFCDGSAFTAVGSGSCW